MEERQHCQLHLRTKCLLHRLLSPAYIGFRLQFAALIRPRLATRESKIPHDAAAAAAALLADAVAVTNSSCCYATAPPPSILPILAIAPRMKEANFSVSI